jgi:spore maturation protein CgeB
MTSLVVLGLSLSSSWGNGHATTYRALLPALARRGHDILFLERDVPWYAQHRDLTHPDYCTLRFYRDLAALAAWEREIAEARAVIVGSYVPEGVAVGRIVQRIARAAVFYDIDTPITLAKLAAGDHEYLSPELIPSYRLYCSFTGGPTLNLLQDRYGSPAARALYCSADPALYRPLQRAPEWDLSYLGTYSADRQPALERMLIEPARRRPDMRFAVAGPMYPESIVWPANVTRIDHLPPADHAGFYAASRFTLNLTRADMARAGHSPSVRLFEAAACAVPIISDTWPGLDSLFGDSIWQADDTGSVLRALHLPEPARLALGERGRARFLAEHTPDHRARAFEHELNEACLADTAEWAQ